MSNPYFWAQDEIRIIQDPQTRLYDSQKAYKDALTSFLLSGLKNLGYQDTYKQLEKESGIHLPKVIDDELRGYIKQQNFDAAIGHVHNYEHESLYSNKNLNILLYELLKLKFIQAMLKGNTVTALFLLRNDLKEFSEFDADKKKLSGLYLLKTSEEIAEASGVYLNDPEYIDLFLNKLEVRLLAQDNTRPSEEPFDYLCRNSLCYEIITCKYHKSFNFANGYRNQLGITNGLKHYCPLEPFPSKVYQTLEETIDELWEVKLSTNSLNIYALTRDRVFICWTFNALSGYYEHNWTSEEPIKEEINDWCLNEKSGTIVIGTAENSIKIVSIARGELITIIQAAHDDAVNKIYVKSQGDEMISVSVDCHLKIWDCKNSSKKDFIKTKRALSMIMGKDEETVFIIYSNYRMIDRINLTDKTIQEKVIVEKDCIVSAAVSPDGTMLLLNTGRGNPELHLYRLNDYRLLNIYKGYVQTKFCLGIGFISNFIIYSGSEDGNLVYWHINCPDPIQRIQLHILSLNSAATAYNEILQRQILVSVSDDYKAKVLITE